MGLEFARGNNARCPPFLVGGLMIMCLFFLCSWWSLSSQNFELLRQNDNLAEQLRINGEELRKYQECMVQVAEQTVQIRQLKESDQELQLKCQNKEKALSDTRERVENVIKERNMCQTEMESLKNVGESKDKSLETLRTEKSSLTEALQRMTDKAAALEESLSECEKGKGRIDMKQSIVGLLGKKKLEGNDNLETGERVPQKDLPSVKMKNTETTVFQDENNGGEIKNDQVAEQGDPREEAMGMNENGMSNF